LLIIEFDYKIKCQITLAKIPCMAKLIWVLHQQVQVLVVEDYPQANIVEVNLICVLHKIKVHKLLKSE